MTTEEHNRQKVIKYAMEEMDKIDDQIADLNDRKKEIRASLKSDFGIPSKAVNECRNLIKMDHDTRAEHLDYVGELYKATTGTQLSLFKVDDQEAA